MYFYTVTKKRVVSIFLSFLVFSLGILTYVYATSDSDDEIKVPIIMYHSILKNTKSEGKYVVTPEVFEKDMQYLINNGYQTVFVSELSDYVRNNAPLPEKPVIITLDDGYYNNYVYALPILKKYNMKASIAVVGKFTDIFSEADSHNANYSHLTWEDIKEIASSGYIEISNHTYNMHDTKGRIGCFKMKSETNEQYHDVLTEDVLKMQKLLKEKSDVECKVFTYPYGKIYNGSIPIIKEMGFLASLSCYEKINTITKDESCLYLLGRFNRPSGITTENFMKKNGL